MSSVHDDFYYELEDLRFGSAMRNAIEHLEKYGQEVLDHFKETNAYGHGDLLTYSIRDGSYALTKYLINKFPVLTDAHAVELCRRAWRPFAFVLEVVLRKGADPNAKDDKGRTLLQLTYDGVSFRKEINLLIRYGATLYRTGPLISSDRTFPERTKKAKHRYDAYYDMADEIRDRLDVLWMFWFVLPKNTFPKLIKHFF